MNDPGARPSDADNTGRRARHGVRRVMRSGGHSGDGEDDVVVVGVIPEAGNPRRVWGARVSQRRQHDHRCEEQHRQGNPTPHRPYNTLPRLTPPAPEPHASASGPDGKRRPGAAVSPTGKNQRPNDVTPRRRAPLSASRTRRHNRSSTAGRRYWPPGAPTRGYCVDPLRASARFPRGTRHYS